jgi:hypothetical protein
VSEAGHAVATLSDGSQMAVADTQFVYRLASAEDHLQQALAQGQSVFKLGAGESLDLSGVASKAGLVEVDMADDTAANTTTLRLADVLGAPTNSEGVHQMVLTGDANDSVNVNLPDWTDTGASVTQAGRTYEVFRASSDPQAQLLMDQVMLNAQHVV